MVKTVELTALGPQQARLFGLLSAEYPLPANAMDYPLGNDQFYGQVATNARLSDSKAAGNKSFMSRSYHVARSAITELAVVVPNWFWDLAVTKFELPNGAGAQFTCSIEYPAGTYTRLRFSDQTRGFCRDFEQMASDFASVTIPSGQGFWVNVWCLHAAGTILFQNAAQNSAAGERLNVSTTQATDQTMTAHSGTAQSSGFWPSAIIGRTSGNPVLIVGDSLQRGIGDSADAVNAIGIVARSVAPQMPYINLGSSGDSLAIFLQAYRKRLQSAAYTRHIVAAHGTNDVRAGRSAAQIKQDLLVYWSLLRARLFRADGQLFQCTLTHSTTSTDNWATTGNQTRSQNFDTGVREDINDWLRDGAPLVSDAPAPTGTAGATRAGSGTHPLRSVFDVADVFETARNSGIWKADGTAAKWTADGIHPSQFGYVQAGASGKIDLSLLA
ncbi:SGNH/GDSL hydrolase family protein [Rhizobium sp. SG2393]|uniref:SGNH/GDSL hydrolase family protein n=1 Tax=Rhizobium sp. SG2393 TaxID=3276279 RepID=UPI003672347D